jgi:hypothetical protein
MVCDFVMQRVYLRFSCWFHGPPIKYQDISSTYVSQYSANRGLPPNGRTHFFIQNSWCQGFGSKSHPKKRSWKDVKRKKCPKMPSKVCPTLIQHWWYHGLNPSPRPQGLGAGGLEDSPRSSSRAWGSVRARAMGHPAPGDPKIAGEWMCIPSKWAVFLEVLTYPHMIGDGHYIRVTVHLRCPACARR